MSHNTAKRWGRCAQCGKLGKVTLDGHPYAHKSGNPHDWYGQTRTSFVTSGPQQPCKGENMTAVDIDAL